MLSSDASTAAAAAPPRRHRGEQGEEDGAGALLKHQPGPIYLVQHLTHCLPHPLVQPDVNHGANRLTWPLWKCASNDVVKGWRARWTAGRSSRSQNVCGGLTKSISYNAAHIERVPAWRAHCWHQA
jgi:hypothetical protein